jgi:hypothetical protein
LRCREPADQGRARDDDTTQLTQLRRPRLGRLAGVASASTQHCVAGHCQPRGKHERDRPVRGHSSSECWQERSRRMRQGHRLGVSRQMGFGAAVGGDAGGGGGEASGPVLAAGGGELAPEPAVAGALVWFEPVPFGAA